MRTIIGLGLLLALPTLAAAQQTAQSQEGDAAPVVELQQSVPAPAAAAPAAATSHRAIDTAPDAAVDAATAEAADVAMQAGPESRQFWYLVGAIVVAGIILAVLL